MKIKKYGSRTMKEDFFKDCTVLEINGRWEEFKDGELVSELTEIPFSKNEPDVDYSIGFRLFIATSKKGIYYLLKKLC